MKVKQLGYVLGMTLVLFGCAQAPKVQLPANLQIIDDFDDLTGWTAFAAPNAKVDIAKDTKNAAYGKASLSIKYSLGDWGGVGETFKEKKSWKVSDSLFFAFKGDGTGKKVRVEITDNGGERFAKEIPVTFTGWETFTIPLTDMKRREDWQPAGAPKDGLTLTAVDGISFSPIEKGKGDWAVDVIGIIPGAK